MSDLERWRSSIVRGAGELLARHSRQPLPPDRAYRLLVWLGRAEQLRERGAELETLRARAAGDALVPTLMARVGLPAPEELLSTLEELLASGADAETELHCALLDVDDLLTVLELVGREAEAEALGREAVVRVERWSWRTGPLLGWAEGRLRTLPLRSAAASLWRAVERGSRFQVLPEVSFLKRAARSGDTHFEPISGPGSELFESDEGRMTLWVEIPPGKGQPQRAVLRMWSRERGGTWSYALAHADLAERAAYFDLGTREELRQRAAEAVGELPGATEAFVLTVELTFDDDPTVSG
jgi:hypothetical protein